LAVRLSTVITDKDEDDDAAEGCGVDDFSIRSLIWCDPKVSLKEEEELLGAMVKQLSPESSRCMIRLPNRFKI